MTGLDQCRSRPVAIELLHWRQGESLLNPSGHGDLVRISAWADFEVEFQILPGA